MIPDTVNPGPEFVIPSHWHFTTANGRLARWRGVERLLKVKDEFPALTCPSVSRRIGSRRGRRDAGNFNHPFTFGELEPRRSRRKIMRVCRNDYASKRACPPLVGLSFRQVCLGRFQRYIAQRRRQNVERIMRVYSRTKDDQHSPLTFCNLPLCAPASPRANTFS
jgi:hypothetical protein